MVYRTSVETALNTFSPREIQARVRSGASAEVVAAETGWPLDKVVRYAEPLLAERAYIAEQAQAVEVRRSGGGSTLAVTAGEALGMDPASGAIAWDAYRREDGKWIVQARFSESGSTHLAEWTYDHAGRNIHPLDDDARALMGVRRQTDDEDAIAALTEALDLISDRPEPAEPVQPETRPRLVAVPDADEPEDVEGAVEDDFVDEPLPIEPAGVSHSEPTITLPTETPAKPAKPAAKKATKARRGRASVPSWDEILFGATRSDD